ncbi:hypothetical protein K461DRAFT_278182 [Myriangium duriaei CBS 260.36]|uniref:Uncharacterized protein n=1 Tax=Myriangium duriaei CBS 260.36 TaxID=1168546 RepID=A0A9P4J0R9_9PEZI|nr:hypothetical protein K461DRAFT_278182 [Myriangium duriaei CBS 260.36]
MMVSVLRTVARSQASQALQALVGVWSVAERNSVCCRTSKMSSRMQDTTTSDEDDPQSGADFQLCAACKPATAKAYTLLTGQTPGVCCVCMVAAARLMTTPAISRTHHTY